MIILGSSTVASPLQPTRLECSSAFKAVVRAQSPVPDAQSPLEIYPDIERY